MTPFLVDGAVPAAEYNNVIKTLHTNSVAESISSFGMNYLLQDVPPPVSESERRLPRAQRATLAQLRTGECRLLRDYQMLVKQSPTAICPECLINRHTVNHLFNCCAAPTDLCVRDLWERPCLVMRFLLTLESFKSIRPTDEPPLPPPPPEPPPPP